MANNGSVTINMSAATLNELQNQNSQLLGFKAIGASQGGGLPVVWFATGSLAQSTQVSWDDYLDAYTAMGQLMPGMTVNASAMFPMGLGQQLTITDPSGMGSVGSGPNPNAIGVVNSTSSFLISGLAQGNSITNQPGIVYASNLPGNFQMMMMPVNKVLLLFSNNPVGAGTVMQQAYGPGVLLDLTGSNNAQVSFDINAGWSNASCPMVTVPAGADLSGYLITQ